MHSHRGTKGSRRFQQQEVTSAERFSPCWLNNTKERKKLTWVKCFKCHFAQHQYDVNSSGGVRSWFIVSLLCEFLCLLACEVIWKTRLSRIPEDFCSTTDPMTFVLVFKRKHVRFYKEQNKYEWFGEPGVSGLCWRISDGRIQCFYSGSVGCSGFQHFNV